MSKKAEKIISVELTEKSVAEILKQLDGIKTLLSETINQYEKEKPKKALKSKYDVTKIATLMDTYPQFIPPYIDSTKSKIDLNNAGKLMEISVKLKSMVAQFQIASTVAIEYSNKSTKAFYKTVKQAAKLNIVDADKALTQIEETAEASQL